MLGEGSLIFCCTGSQENCFGSVGRQNNNNNNSNNNNNNNNNNHYHPKFQGWHI